MNWNASGTALFPFHGTSVPWGEPMPAPKIPTLHEFRGWVNVELAMRGTPSTNYPASTEEVERYYSGFRNEEAVAQMIYEDRVEADIIDSQL